MSSSRSSGSLSSPKSPSLSPYISEKLITIVLCILPITLVILFAYILIDKSKSDLCNPANYSCELPFSTGVGLQNQPQNQPQKATPAAPDSTAYGSNLAKAKAAAAKAMANANAKEGDNFVAVSSIKHQCIAPGKLINGPTKQGSMKVYTAVTIILMIILILFVIIVSLGFTDDNTHEKLINFLINFDDEHKLNTLEPEKDIPIAKTIGLLIPASIVIVILTIVYLAKQPNTIKEQHAAFSISLIGMFTAIIASIRLISPIPNMISYILTILMFIALVALIVGTIMLHTTEIENLKKGYLSTAVNNTAMKSIPIFMGIVALCNLGAIGYGVKHHKTSKSGIIFMITQGISFILLVACIGFYYNYKFKCDSHSVITCKPVERNTYDKDGSLNTEIYCKPITNMPVSTNTVSNMGIAMCVLMTLTQIVGVGAAVMS